MNCTIIIYTLMKFYLCVLYTEERIQKLSDDKKAVEKEVIICYNALIY